MKTHLMHKTDSWGKRTNHNFVVFLPCSLGSILANGGGGSSYGGGGGGGLVALKYHTGSIHGKVAVNGGSSSHHAGASDVGASGVIYHEIGEGFQVYKKVRYRCTVSDLSMRSTGDQIHYFYSSDCIQPQVFILPNAFKQT